MHGDFSTRCGGEENLRWEGDREEPTMSRKRMGSCASVQKRYHVHDVKGMHQMLHDGQVGFVAGFLCSFLGGVSENHALLGVGIAFVGIFIVGIVMLITSAVSLQKSQAQVRRQRVVSTWHEAIP